MTEAWPEVRLGDLVLLQRGHDLPARIRVPGPIPVVGSGGPSGWHNEAKAQGPGVVIGRATNLGKPFWVEGPFWPLNTGLYVKDFRGNDPRFIFHLFESLDLSGFDSGSVQPMLNRNYIAGVRLRIPPLAEQRWIAGVLGALDDLIDTNRRQRATAEDLGLALVITHASDGFDLVDGTAPAGWSLVSLDEASATLESGNRPKGGVAGIDSGIPSIGAESIKGLGIFDFSKTKFVPRSFADAMKRGRLESHDVLVYKDGGKPGEFRPHVGMFGNGFPFEEMTINEHVYRVRAASPLTNAYLYFWLSSQRLLDEMAMLGTGAAIPGLNSTAFKSLPVAIPPLSVRNQLFPALGALADVALGSAIEIRELTRTRDELLPLLLSGAVSVREVAA